jgi:spore maturation protein CgeB
MNWYCNASYQFDLVRDIAPAYDYCLVPEKDRLDAYRAVGANPVYCPEAANPEVYGPRDVPEEFDVAFVGQRYGDRPEWIAYLLGRHIDVRVWGPGWRAEDQDRAVGTASAWSRARRTFRQQGPRAVMEKVLDRFRHRIPAQVCGGPLSDEGLVQMFSRARISLGLSSCGDTHRGSTRVLQVRLRDIEALMSGAFYVTEYQEDLAEMFEEDEEIVFYRSKEELADKIQFYLRRDDLRRAIRVRARRRALADHSWQRRFEAVFRQIGLSSPDGRAAGAPD